jgi:hypothetical protein
MAVGHGDNIDGNDIDALSDRREVRRPQQHCRKWCRVPTHKRVFQKNFLSLLNLIEDVEQAHTPIRRTSLTGVHAP